jgi:hypothetical protein
MDDLVLAAAVLGKLPLADAVWRLLQYTLDDPFLESIWERNRGRCYERNLKFSTLAHLVADALVEHGGSGRQSFERAREADALPVSIGSTYEKLGNLPLAVSEAMLEEGTQRLEETLPERLVVDPLPACWVGHEVFAADGKAIKHIKRLLKPLRGLQAGILGARAAVALNLRTGMALSMVGHLDGEAGEAALTQVLLQKMAALAGAGRRWVVVLDRLYCNLIFPGRVLKAGGHFVIRYCANTAFVPDPARPAQESRDARERRIVQEWGRLGKTKGARGLYVRRITLYLATGTQISLVTDLLDEDAYPAEDLLATYLNRWGIEKVFQQITEVFSLRHLIGTTPKAVLFQLSFCLLLYNTLQVVRAHLAFHQGCAAEKISNEKLFYDVKRQMVAVNELVETEPLLSLLGQVPTAFELRKWLRRTLRNTWTKRWWKAPSSRGGGHKKVKTRVLGNHTSTYRVLNGQKDKEIRHPICT